MSLVIRAKPYPPTPRNRVRPPISGSGNGEQERGMFSPQTASQEDRAAGGNIIDNERDDVGRVSDFVFWHTFTDDHGHFVGYFCFTVLHYIVYIYILSVNTLKFLPGKKPSKKQGS